MSASQRRKGQRSERELCALLSDELGFTIRRNVDQARMGGHDCGDLPGYSIEIKRHERLSKPSWWRQAVRQGADVQAEPIVFFRRSRQPWRVLISWPNPQGFKEVSFEEALDVIRDKLARLYGIYPTMKEAA